MTKKIIVNNKILQDAINYFVDYTQEEMTVNLNEDILHPDHLNDLNDIAYDCFDNYKVYDEDLWAIAQALGTQGYNVFEKASETCSPNIAVSLETLTEYVLDKVNEHQVALTNNQKQTSVLTQ